MCSIVKKIGVVGIGKIGQGMAKTLLCEGHAVTVFDISKDALGPIIKLGATASD